jgi:D-3-phosphoglycerate dehydrogenase
MNKKILITAHPFCEYNDLPLKLLKKNKLTYYLNPFKRRLKEKEIFKLLKKFDGIIADTEPLTNKVLNEAKKLKIISRVGIGLNNVDLVSAKKNNIKVAYTPDAPTDAVVELTLGLIFNSIRKISEQNYLMKKKIWNRIAGFRIPHLKFGIIGLGRIGIKVAKNLKKLGAKQIFYNDIVTKKFSNFKFKSKDYIYKNCDIVSLHVPLTNKTKNLITVKEISKMKKNCILINTSRGGIINENDLLKSLSLGRFFSVALDVFNNEPYYGALRKFDRCILTPHVGSMSFDCRNRMELEATEAVVNYFNNKKINNLAIK